MASLMPSGTVETFTGVSAPRGVNLSGGEFAPDPTTLPGTYTTDYSYDSATAIANVGARGHDVVRLPIRWERIQPTRNAALNSTEVGRIETFASDCAAAGMTVILDVHNFGRYINSTANGGATLVLGDTLPTADFLDLWTRLSVAFKSNANISVYDIMNEANTFLPVAGTFSGTVRYNFNDGTVQGWTGDGATATNVASKLRLASTATAGSYNYRKDSGGTVAGSASGNVLSVIATLVTNPGGNWRPKLQWQTTGFIWRDGVTTYTRVDTGATVSELIAGVAVRVTTDFTSTFPISSPNGLCIQTESSNATAGAVSVDYDDVAQGTMTGAKTEARVWEEISQLAVNTIRGNADDHWIHVGGYQFSSARYWTQNHPEPWITDTLNKTRYDAHYYADASAGNPGFYAASYATENSAAVTAGYASLTAQAVAQLSVFTNWVTTKGVLGFVSEIGWPNNADTASWNAVGEAMYDVLDAATIGATYWAAGARWGTTYILSLYTGTTQTTIKSQATTVESHPSLTVATPNPTNWTLALNDGTGGGFQIVNNQGRIRSGNVAINRTSVRLNGVIVADADVVFDWVVNPSGSYSHLMMRSSAPIDTGTGYQILLGATDMYLSRRVTYSNYLDLVTYTHGFTVGQAVRTRMAIFGQRIRVRTWLQSNPEPTSVWQIDTTDTGGVSAAGYIGWTIMASTAGSKDFFIDNVDAKTTLTPQQATIIAGGTILTVGTLRKLPTKSFAGTVSSSGAFTKIRAVVRLLAGTVVPTGALRRTPNKTLVGVLAPTATTVKQVNKKLAGSVASSATFRRAFIKRLTGNITPAGASTVTLIGRIFGSPGQAVVRLITDAAVRIRHRSG